VNTAKNSKNRNQDIVVLSSNSININELDTVLTSEIIEGC
jgi:hypothetical protein